MDLHFKMGNENSKDEKEKPQFQNTNKTQTKKLNVLPIKMAHVNTMIDPSNDKNYFIFGTQFSNECWYFNHKTQTLNKIKDIPKFPTQRQVWQHNCAMFETINDGNSNTYALIYGGDNVSGNATYNIYEFKTKKWNKIALQLNNLWFDNDNIMKHGKSMYGFGRGLSMITDLFAKNKIHVIGGDESAQKYGYFEFNEKILNNSNLSYVFFVFL